MDKLPAANSCGFTPALTQGNYRVIYKVKPKEILVLVVKSYRQQLKENEIEA